MDFENRNNTPGGQQPREPAEPQAYAQPVENPQASRPPFPAQPEQTPTHISDEAAPSVQPTPDAQPPQTPYQTPVRASDEPRVFQEEAPAPDGVQPPFAPGTQSYATFREWQEQESKKRGKHVKKPRSKKPLIALGGIAAAAALFFGGMALGGIGHLDGGSPSASSTQKDENLPVLNISSTPSDNRETSSADGVLAGEDIYKKLNDSIVAIQTADSSGQVVSSGSGVVMSSDGYIITNAHVILDEDTSVPMSGVAVLFSDGTQLNATVKGYDSQTDLAVIKVEPSTALSPAEFGDSDALQVGEAAYAIGSPGGVELANSMTSGIISAINRDITVNDRVMTLIQTNVTINPGNSGGALINQYGQVVGITSAKLGISYYEGLGFAIPINSAKEIIDELIQTGYISGRPSIGISGRDVSEQMSQFYNLPEGVQIVSVDSRAKAASEGLQAGDVITAVNGKSITSMNEINKIKEDMKAGDSLTLTIYRPSAQKSQNLKITLTDAHDLEGADPAQERQQQSSSNGYGNGSNRGGYIDPFRYFFGGY